MKRCKQGEATFWWKPELQNCTWRRISAKHMWTHTRTHTKPTTEKESHVHRKSQNITTIKSWGRIFVKHLWAHRKHNQHEATSIDSHSNCIWRSPHILHQEASNNCSACQPSSEISKALWPRKIHYASSQYWTQEVSQTLLAGTTQPALLVPTTLWTLSDF